MPSSGTYKVVTGSMMPIATECPGSLHPTIGISVASEAASLGSELHALIDRYINGLGTGEIPDELRESYDWFKTLWATLDLRDVKTEVSIDFTLDDIRYLGRLDLVAAEDTVFIDWKSGRGEGDYLPQLITYAAGRLSKLAENKPIDPDSKILLLIINLTLRTKQHWVFTAKEIIDWMELYHRKIKYWSGTYRAGEHCRYCPARFTCKAFEAMLISATRTAIQTLKVVDPFIDDKVWPSEVIESVEMAREVSVNLYPILGMAIKTIQNALDRIKVLVNSSADRQIETDKGVLWMSDVISSKVNVQESADFIASMLGRDVFYSLLDVKMGDLEKAFEQWYKSQPLEMLSDSLKRRNKKGEERAITLDELHKWVRGNLSVRTSSSSRINHKAKKGQ